MPKLCDFQNCRIRASYGLIRNCPERCRSHMENRKLVSMICNCGKARPNFNEVGETQAVCCSSCKTDTMVDVKSKKCRCRKAQPIYNEPGETQAVCCSSCKTATMVDVISKKCRCGKARPHFNEVGETDAVCCSSCKTDTMVDVKSKKCRCGKSRPHFNEVGETIPVCCASCKTDTMVDVKSKKCRCGKAQPHFNELGETFAVCCVSCKTDTMVDVKNKRCNGFMNMDTNTLEPCPNDTVANVKYKNYCTECFRRNFPLDPLTFQIRSKTKEIAVRDFINANFEGFQHNARLQTGHCDCTIRRSIDHRMLIGNTLIAIETDENQHKAYNEMDEETRYDDLFMAHSGKWIYIRFNPDKYINAQGVRKNPMIATRLDALKTEIEKQIIRVEREENVELVERVYMYYDGYA
jgi:hypothetical protein